MEAKIFTKVNDGSYKEYFKGSQKDVYVHICTSEEQERMFRFIYQF